MYRKISGMLLAAGMAALFGDLAYAEEFSTRLNGFQEIGGLGAGETGAILSDGKGTLNLDVGKTQITYTLTYSGLGRVDGFDQDKRARKRDEGGKVLCG